MAIKEVDGYKARKVAPMKENPLKCWQQNTSFFFQRLAKLTARYFCVKATSVASEFLVRQETLFMPQEHV